MRHAGVGFRSGATLDSVRDALRRAGGGGLTRIAIPAVKAADPLAAELAASGLALTLIPPDALARTPTPTQGPLSLRTHRTGSVAEACALIAAGPGARLLAPRTISQDRMATAAVAEGVDP